MDRNIAFRRIFMLVLSCFIGSQVVNAKPLSDFVSGSYGKCPYGRVCTGDIVLITMQTDLKSFQQFKDGSLAWIDISVARDPLSNNKRYILVDRIGKNFHGFYYRVKPGEVYNFKATYHYYKNQQSKILKEFSVYFYYKARGDASNPDGSDVEGLISPHEAQVLRLPAMPRCTQKMPGSFCTNQVVHIFWNNDLGPGKKVSSIDLYINGKYVKHGDGPYFNGHFQDYYYTLPKSQYSGAPVSFNVTWKVEDMAQGGPPHFEHSQTLRSSYAPEWADLCRPGDSWQYCQNAYQQ